MKITYVVVSIVLFTCSHLIASERKDQPLATPSLLAMCLDVVAAHAACHETYRYPDLALENVRERVPADMFSYIQSYMKVREKRIQRFLKKYVWITKKDNEFPTQFALNTLTPGQLASLDFISIQELFSCNLFTILPHDFIERLSNQWSKNVDNADNQQNEITAAIQLFFKFNELNSILLDATPKSSSSNPLDIHIAQLRICCVVPAIAVNHYRSEKVCTARDAIFQYIARKEPAKNPIEKKNVHKSQTCAFPFFRKPKK